MADGDAKRPGESKDEVSARPRETPVRSHVDMGVHVSRDLNANGPLARGYNSNMSKLNFSARALPRDESATEEPAAQPVVSAPVQAPDTAASSPATPAAPDANGPLSWLTGLFTRR